MLLDILITQQCIDVLLSFIPFATVTEMPSMFVPVSLLHLQTVQQSL